MYYYVSYEESFDVNEDDTNNDDDDELEGDLSMRPFDKWLIKDSSYPLCKQWQNEDRRRKKYWTE